MNVSFRDKYPSGWGRPLLRGAVHAVCTVALAWVYSLLWFTNATTSIPHLETMVSLKLTSYFASVMYHFVPYETTDLEFVFYSTDVVCINLAVIAPYAPWALSDTNELAWSSVTLCCVIVATIRLMAHEAARVAVQGAFAAAVICRIGYLAHFCSLWCLGTLLYALAFAAAPPMNRSYRPMPHHSPRWWGWHEDFHTLLAAADVCYAVLALHCA